MVQHTETTTLMSTPYTQSNIGVTYHREHWQICARMGCSLSGKGKLEIKTYKVCAHSLGESIDLLIYCIFLFNQ